MFTTKKTVTLVALALAGALSIGAVASAQAQNGAAGHSDDLTPVTSVSPTPSPTDSEGRGDGTVNDYLGTEVTPTSVPTPSTELPTDADHPHGDDSIASAEGDHRDGEEVGEEVGEDAAETKDVAETEDASTGAVSDDAAGHDVGDNHDAPSGDSAGHDSADSSEHSD